MENQELKDALGAAQKAHEDYKATAAKMGAEQEKLGRVTADTQAKIERIEKDVDAKVEAAQKRWDEIERRLNRERAMGNGDHVSAAEQELNRFNAVLQRDLAERKPGVTFKPMGAEQYSLYKAGFIAYVKEGPGALDATPEFRAAMHIASDPKGGYLVPADISGRIVEFVRETSAMRQVAAIATTTKDAKEGKYDLGEVAATWVGETSSRSRAATPEWAKYRIPVHEMAALFAASQNDLDDSDNDVEAWLIKKAGQAFSLAENLAFVTGNTPLRPRGFTTYAAGTPAATSLAAYQKIEQIVTGHASTFKAAPDGADVFVDMYGAVKDDYLARAVWAMKRSTLSAARKLKDSNGAYQLVQLGQSLNGRPGFEIMGHPVLRWDGMAALGSNALAIAFGDFGAGYQIVDRQGMRFLRDPYSSKGTGEVEFYFTKRVGGAVIDFDALKLGKCST